MVQKTLSRFGLSRDDGKHEQGFEWNHLLHMKTVILGWQQGKVVARELHKGCCIGNKGGQLERHNGNIEY